MTAQLRFWAKGWSA